MFDIFPILIEGRSYVEATADFEVKVLGEIKIEGNNTTQFIESLSTKECLIEFLYKCEEEALKGRVNLIQFLKEYGKNWGDWLTNYTTWFERETAASSADWRIKQLKDRQELYKRFHNYNYNLITLVRCRVMQLPLPDYLEAELKQTLLKKNGNVDLYAKQPPNLDFHRETVNQSSPNNELPILFIKADIKYKLYEALLAYVDDKSHQDLENLIINNIPPKDKIPVICLVKQLGATFFGAKAVPKGKAEFLSKQVSNFFVVNTGENLKEISHSNLVKYLRKGRRD